MVVTASYDNSTTSAVSGYTYTPNGALSTSDTEVTISYAEGGVTETATQNITVALKIYTESELQAMTIPQITDIANARGYTITQTLKADIIAEFLTQQGT